MGYVAPEKPDIFVSYAQADNSTLPDGSPGWVSYFVRWLEIELKRHVGPFELWMDLQLPANARLSPAIEAKIRDCAVMIIIHSQAYLSSPWCQREMSQFLEKEVERRSGTKSAIFVVELSDVGRPPALKKPELLGRRFWVRDPDSKRVHLLGYTMADRQKDQYVHPILELGQDIAAELKRLKTKTEGAALDRGKVQESVIAANPGDRPSEPILGALHSIGVRQSTAPGPAGDFSHGNAEVPAAHEETRLAPRPSERPKRPGKSRCPVWIVGAGDGRKRLEALKLQDWLISPCLRTYQLRDDGYVLDEEYKNQQPFGRDLWKVAPFVRLCRERLSAQDVNFGGPSGRLMLLCGPRGVGKSVLLWRMLADRSDYSGLASRRFLLDFASNVAECAKKKRRDDFADGIEAVRALFDGSAPTIGAASNAEPLFLMVDGLDTAARFVSTRFEDELAWQLVQRVVVRLLELAAVRGGVVLVVSMDVSPMDKSWAPLFEVLEPHGVAVASLEQLPDPAADRATDQGMFDEYYKDYVRPERAEYVEKRVFLRLPLFLDAARRIKPRTKLKDLHTQLQFLLSSRDQGTGYDWEHHLFREARDIDRFLKGFPTNVLYEKELRSLLAREWAGGWIALLTDEIRHPKSRHLSTAMRESLEILMGDKEDRLRLRTSFALSNVITALVKAGVLAGIENEQFMHCNLQRTTFDGVSFVDTRFHAVNCSGSSFLRAKVVGGSRFVATDFTDCRWDDGSDQGEWSTIFVECQGNYPGSGHAGH